MLLLAIECADTGAISLSSEFWSNEEEATLVVELVAMELAVIYADARWVSWGMRRQKTNKTQQATNNESFDWLIEIKKNNTDEHSHTGTHKKIQMMQKTKKNEKEWDKWSVIIR